MLKNKVISTISLDCEILQALRPSGQKKTQPNSIAVTQETGDITTVTAGKNNIFG